MSSFMNDFLWIAFLDKLSHFRLWQTYKKISDLRKKTRWAVEIKKSKNDSSIHIVNALKRMMAFYISLSHHPESVGLVLRNHLQVR